MGDVVERLQQLGPFAGMDMQVVLAVGSGLNSISLSPDDELVQVGEVAHEVYVVASGRLEVLTASTADGGIVLAELPRGSVVGEVAVLTGGRRTATLRAAEETDVISISADAFRTLLDASPEFAGRIAADARRRLRENQLARHLQALFPVPASDLGDMAGQAEFVPLGAGEILFRAGDEADAAYVVVAGRLRVLTDGPDGTFVPLAEIGAGELVGELALLDDMARSATVVAARNTEVARIPRVVFDALVHRHPTPMLAITRMIVRRSRDTQDLFHRAAAASMSIGLLPLTTEVDIDGLATQLAASMGVLGAIEHVSSVDVDRRLDAEGIADAAPGSGDELRLERWLAEIEDQTPVLLLEGDASVSPWTRRCVEQVDHLVLVANADGHTDVSELERQLVVERELPHQRVSLVLIHEPDVDRPRNTAAWLDVRDVDQHHHVRRDDPDDLARLARHLTGRAVTLVLSGGGAKGFAHLGVVRAMRELGLPIDAIAGASMGAPLAATVAIGTPNDELVPLVARLYHKVLDYTVPVTSLVSARRIVRSIEEGVGDRDIEDAWLPFFCVSTNLTRSRLETHRRGSMLHALRASLSIPGIMPPVPFGDDLLVDGGVLNNLPVDIARELYPTGTIIASDVAPLLGPRAKSDYGTFVSGTGVLARRMTPGMKAPRVPALVATLMRSLLVAAAEQRDRGIAAGLADLHLQLDLRGVSLLDFEACEPVAEKGYREALGLLSTWMEHQNLTVRQPGVTERSAPVS